MLNYEFFNPTKVISGEKSIHKLPFELKRLGAARPALLSDSVLEKIGSAKKITSIIKEGGIEAGMTFTAIPPESDTEVVNEIGRIFKDKQCDSIIALGGGSVLDTAKGTNMLVSSGRSDILGLCGMENISFQLYKAIAIPTTSGTGSEATEVAVISNLKTRVKMEFCSTKIIFDSVILDPEMTATMPPRLTAATGIDALAHAVEAFSGRQSNPCSDIFSITALKLIADNIEKCIAAPDDREARLAMANASYYAGVGFSNSMVGIVHAIGHAVGAVSKVPHAYAMAVLLPHGMRFNFPVSIKKYDTLGMSALGISGEELIKWIEALLARLNKSSGLPASLKECGVKREDFIEISEKALNDGAVFTSPRQFNKNDVMAILEKSF